MLSVKGKLFVAGWQDRNNKMPQFDFTDGFERMDAALSTGADVVPFTAQMHEFAMKQSAIPGHEFYTDAKKLVRGILETCRDFEFDMPFLLWDVYDVEAEALGAKLVLFEDMAPAIDNVEPIIRTEKDLARLRAPDPYSSGRMPMVFEALREYRELTGRPAAPCYCAPFTLASQCMTFERLILAIKDNPKFVHRVMAFLVEEVIAPYMNALLREFPDAPVADGSDAVASLPFITQDMLEEFSLPYIEKLQKLCVKPAICDNWWGDSHADDVERFWEMKLRATPNYLKVQDPDLFKIGATAPKAYAEKRDVPLVFGVDNLVLQNGPAETIEQRIHEYLEIGEPGGRFVLYLCSLSAETPADNVRVAIRAIKDYRAGKRPHGGRRLSGEAVENGSVAEVAPTTVEVRPPSPRSDRESDLLDDIFDAVLDHEDEKTAELVRTGLSQGVDVHTLLDDALIAAMDEVGDMFSDGTIFVPEMLMAARAMKSGLEVVRPVLTETGAPPKGKVLLATVQGDVHDIGKNLVGMMMEGAGYTVVDLGVNVTKEDIAAAAEEQRPDVVGLSALLTTSMPSMAKTVAEFKHRGLGVPILIGGAPVTEAFASSIGADGYGESAPDAVDKLGAFIDKTETDARIS